MSNTNGRDEHIRPGDESGIIVFGGRGSRVAEEATEQTEKVLRKTEKVTKGAELRTAVFSALKTADYDGLSVAEISRRLEGLSTGELKKVREYEKRNKNRETLIEQIDRKIRAKSS